MTFRTSFLHWTCWSWWRLSTVSGEERRQASTHPLVTFPSSGGSQMIKDKHLEHVFWVLWRQLKQGRLEGMVFRKTQLSFWKHYNTLVSICLWLVLSPQWVPGNRWYRTQNPHSVTLERWPDNPDDYQVSKEESSSHSGDTLDKGITPVCS